jgi:ATP-dependent Clp protease, protease subunit
MPEDILLYGDINSCSSAEFIGELDEYKEDDIVVRINSGGGSPEYGWGMIAKFVEHPGKKLIKVDGQAHSMAAFFLCYCDEVEALDVAEFVVHRAAYSPWFESTPDCFTQPVRENLERVNISLRKALESKIDVAKFEELKGVKIKDIFSMDSRIDVVLSATEAKKVGLINRIIKITPEKRSEIEAMVGKAAKFSGLTPQKEVNKTEISKLNIMTIEKLKAEHPELFATVLAQGAAQEKDRIGAVLVFTKLDPTIKAAIDSDKPLSETTKAELTLASFKNETIGKIAGSATATVIVPEVEKEKTEKEKELAAFEAASKKALGLAK